MNAIKFLLKEHDKVRKTLADISNESHRFETKKEMFDSLCNDLVAHETMEQKKWYPHFKNREDLDETVKHLISEEKTAAKEIKEFKKIDSEIQWGKKFSAFRKAIESHANEEEKKLFPKVEKLFNEEELEKIGKEMHEFKNEIEK